MPSGQSDANLQCRDADLPVLNTVLNQRNVHGPRMVGDPAVPSDVAMLRHSPRADGAVAELHLDPIATAPLWLPAMTPNAVFGIGRLRLAELDLFISRCVCAHET